MRRHIRRLVGAGALSVFVLTAGCATHQIAVRDLRAGTEYKAEVKVNGACRAHTVVSAVPGNSARGLRLDGTCSEMVLDPTGQYLALAMKTCRDNMPYEHVVIVDALRLEKQRDFEPIPNECRNLPGNAVQRIGQLDYNADGSELAVYYQPGVDCYPACDGRRYPGKAEPVITVWDAKRLVPLRTLCMPRANPNFHPAAFRPEVTDMKFSPDGKYIALYGFYDADVSPRKDAFSRTFHELLDVLLILDSQNGKLNRITTIPAFLPNKQITWVCGPECCQVRLPDRAMVMPKQ